ncbi:sugar transferase [Telmatocola sphagniphila]|uniref:Sugar transferase n=1 Tax=Telmatocola sphagniphila TaxID=1123043 RepID=A0A8E6F0P1_9BACT|nr:sugar transferase [Telmatocola sphagniphila]QVL34766.1 sugar transferase [Telmatocola sphagniphila]
MQLLESPPISAPVSVTTTKMLPVYLQTAATNSATYALAKRILDVAVAAIMLLCLMPLFLVIGLIIKFTDGGPIFFKQRRVGLNGKVFDFYKFRSMVINAEALKAQLMEKNKHNNSITFKMNRDPRVTWIGRIIRKTSIDELPQFFNVLCGDMSLVGPRPAVVSEVEKYTSHERRRLGTLPGLTCIWQVSGRADLDFRQQVELDLRYIRERSFWLDVQLMFKTIPAVLSGKGAY